MVMKGEEAHRRRCVVDLMVPSIGSIIGAPTFL